MEKVYEKFLRYVKVPTTSDESSTTVPSTNGQLKLAHLLVKELLNMGIEDAHVDDFGYVYGTLKGNVDAPVIGLIAHLDTSPACSGEHIKPKIIKEYDGKDILLNPSSNIVMKVCDFEYLKNYVGHTLITSDGTTLLGADDKAGVAEIMTIIEYLIHHPDLQHGDIKIAFTPDEEIGRGADHFDVKKFGADFAYTLDGGFEGEIEYENFNAASASIKINGVNIHPGSAKFKMKNAIRIGMELNSLLPVFEVPEYTQDYEGFFLLDHFDGEIECTKMDYIIRDHDMNEFNKKKDLLRACCNFLNTKYGSDAIKLHIEDSYFNMKEKILPVIHIVDAVIHAMKKVGVKPIVKPIRGGTDGARLSYMGLPTPNVFTGGFNFHGRFEAISVQSMDQAVQTMLEVLKSFAQKS